MKKYSMSCMNRLFIYLKQKTYYERCISDWSSDVCSSDLSGPTSPPSPSAASTTKTEPSLGGSMLRGSPEPERMFSVAANTNPPSAHTLPAAPAGFGEGRWIPPGESVEVAGMNLPGGMLYVGGRLKALNGGTDPCLISGQYNVARVGNYRSEEHTSELQYLMRNSYAVFCL